MRKVRQHLALTQKKALLKLGIESAPEQLDRDLLIEIAALSLAEKDRRHAALDEQANQTECADILANQILQQISRQLGAAQAQLAIIGAQSAEQKLAAFLLSVADLSDESHDREFDLPMRRGDMAEFLGLRLETVSRKMTEFQRRGWIKLTSL